MGTVIWFKNIRIEIRAKEKNHTGRPHCHAVRGEGRRRDDISIDLVTMTILAGGGYSKNDVAKIIEEISAYRQELLEKWEEYHG